MGSIVAVAAVSSSSPQLKSGYCSGESVPSKANMGMFKPREQKSYLSVPGEDPLCDKTVGELVDDAAELYGSTEALYDRATNARLTFHDVKQETDILAAGFVKLGFQKGDRVGIYGPNSWRWYITQLALAKVGIISVMLNPASQSLELLYCFNKVRMRGIVVAGKFKGQSLCEILKQALPELSDSQPGLIRSERAPSLSVAVTMESEAPYQSMLTYEQVLDGGRAQANGSLDTAKRNVSFDDLFCIHFTSGTTGKPKGVMLTHHNVVNDCDILVKRFDFISKDKLCLNPPLFHCYGTVFGALAGLRFGFGLVLPSPEFDPLASVKVILEERCTVVCGTPTMHVDMLALIEKGAVEAPVTLRKALSGGASCPAELIRQMKRTYGVESVVNGYGLTETSSTCLMSLPGDSDEFVANTTGYPLENNEIKIVNERGETVAVGEPGELCVRSCTVMPGYWEDAEKTRDALDENRWLHTGDLFVMEPSGHCRIVGRIKDMIIRGGENISPAEVENLLQSHPAIIEAHVFAVPDKRLGEVVAAWIRVRDGEELTEEQVRRFCTGKISAFKIPKYIKFTAQFPKTTSGKIQKYQMRELMTKELRLSGIMDG